MSQTDKSFTVSDRRHFTADGRPREGEEVTSEPEPSPVEPPRPEAAVPPAVPPVEERSSVPPVPPAATQFSGFLLTLAAQAGVLLSGEGRAEGEERLLALEGARSIMSILEMLKDKTEGRRTDAENALLDDLLFQLRMAYVEKTRAGEA